MTAAEIVAMFNADSRCAVLSYDIVDNTGSTIATNDELYTRYALATRTTNAIEIDTTEPFGGTDNSFFYYIKIKAVS